MKKQLLSILTAGCLMAAMVPAAFAADANDLQAQIDAAEAGSTIKLNENTTITTPLNINKSITLDGNGYTLTTIINRKGFDLPVTGGFGTLLFSGIGALLVVGGIGVLMSTKKKKKGNA